MNPPCRRSTPSSTLITLNVDVTQHAHRRSGRGPPRGQAGDRLRLRQPGDADPHGGQRRRSRAGSTRPRSTSWPVAAGRGPMPGGPARSTWCWPRRSPASSTTGCIYRGHDAADLARTSTLEAVAELLWTGTLPEPAEWPADPSAVRVARAADAGLPESSPLTERLAVITAALACANPLRIDLQPRRRPGPRRVADDHAGRRAARARRADAGPLEPPSRGVRRPAAPPWRRACGRASRPCRPTRVASACSTPP